ncbi:uncharacterized protein DS421_6g193040 [Arachis hypogaea]|nr:uncharacterized protein DS421_6g193040 [Arachis hypogaea]
MFLGRNLGQTRPKIIFSVLCNFCRSRMSRVCVGHAYASFSDFPLHACTSGTRSRHLRELQSTRMRQARVCVAVILSKSCASLFAGCLLDFLCSFPFCKLPLHSLSHSSPIKPEILNHTDHGIDWYKGELKYVIKRSLGSKFSTIELN